MSPPSQRSEACEEERLAALHCYDILDTSPEERFDRITRLAAHLLDAPMAQINLIDAERQWSKSSYGLEAEERARTESWCARAIQSDDVTVIEDAAADDRFADHPIVTGPPHLRFYAGAPLITADGHRLGTLCVYDTTPRQLSSDQKDRLADLAATVVDELELRRSQCAVERQKQRVENLLDGLPELFFLFEEGGRLQRWNRNLSLLSGYSDEEIASMYPLDFVAEEERGIAGAHIAEAFETGEATAEITFASKEGERIPVRCVARRVTIEDRPCLMGIGVDISQHQQTEAALQASEETFRRLFEGANDALLVFSPDDAVILAANARAAELYGYPREELIGRSLNEFSQDPENGRAKVHEVLQKGRLSDYETRHMRRDGAPIELSVNASLIEYEGEQAILAIQHDITKHKQRERELAAAREEAEERAHLKDALLANMSHEIRTPLTGMIGFAEVLADEVPDEYKQFARLIQKSGRRLQDTLNSVLELSRLEAGSYKRELAPVDVGEQVEHVLDLFQKQANEKGIDLRMETPATSVVERLDETVFNRILTNLLSNAIKFTKEGAVTVQISPEPDHLVLRVRDTGIGIEEKFLPHLFEAFEQESAEMSRSHTGTGLGLSITRKLVELLDGTIEVESEKGVGSVFTVRLPRRPA